jgi:hypothetical protein
LRFDPVCPVYFTIYTFFEIKMSINLYYNVIIKKNRRGGKK